MSTLRPIPEILKESGLVPGTKEYRRAYWREQWNRKDPELRKEKGRKLNEARKRRFREDDNYRQATREKWKNSKRKKREKHGASINKKQREYYKSNKERLRKLIYEARKRRDPTRGLASLINMFRRGEIGLDELDRSISAAIIQLDALANGAD